MQSNLFLIFLGCILFSSCAKEIVKPSYNASGPGNTILVKSDTILDVTRIEWQYNNKDYPSAELGIYTVIPNLNPNNNQVAACTGLGYNPLTNQFVVAFHNGASASKIWLFDRSALIPYNAVSAIMPVPSGQIDVSAYIDYIEGIDYDADLHVYWALGTKKGADKNDNNRVLISVDESGALVGTYDLSAYSFKPGMLVNVGNYLIIKPDNYYWLLVLDKISKQMVGQYQTFSKNEGLGVNKINGDIWLADNDGTIKRFTSKLKELGTFNSTTFNNEVEGLLVDPADGTLWDAADTYFHGLKINGNAIWHYDFAKTYKKFIRFPEMADFTKGTASNGLGVTGTSINGTGIWESPVMDFKGYKDFLKNTPSITERGKKITIEYRGSNSPPTTVINSVMPCSYYQGWGDTVPGDYTVSPSDHRYQQIKLIIK